MNDKKYFCVISHTHWDREWYMPFEQFRVRLVELVDRLFDIIAEYPAYIFHLDAQTIVLEDYLEIRPWRRDLLVKYITQGNILVGPWYLQNDFYLTSGESTVRNMLIGTRIAEEFGKCTRIGYAPDQFGNISQLPQILNQFGVDNFIFGRGYGKFLFDENGEYLKDSSDNPIREKAPTEFIWEGADGSKLLAVHMKYWYNNAQRIYQDTEAAVALMDSISNSFDGFAVTPYLLLMNGVDHLEAQSDLIPVISAINDNMENGSEILQCSMNKYIDDIKAFIESENIKLRTYAGELRDGNDWEILKGTLSSRVYLKQQNCRSQTELESVLEPMSSIYELAGAVNSYDNDYLQYLWKQLLKNHPHDSICGCSRDEVHDHMEDNFAKLQEAAKYLEVKKSVDITAHTRINTKNPDDNIICLINTISQEHAGILEVEVVFLSSENVEAFAIKDDRENSINFAVIGIEERKHDVFTALNLPGVLDVKAFRIIFYDCGTNGFSIKGLKVVKIGRFMENQLQTGIANIETYNFPVSISNEYIRVSADQKGRVTLEFLEDDREVENAIVIEEQADCGDSYVFKTNNDIPIYSINFPTKIYTNEILGLRKSIIIEYMMEIPTAFDFVSNSRLATTTLCPVVLTLTLDRQSKILKTAVSFNNNSEDHRMRLLVDTGIKSSISFGDIPFDILEHGIGKEYPLTNSNVHPNTSFAGIENENYGVAVLTCGNHEYEHLASTDKIATPSGSVIAFTLVRGNKFIMMGSDNKSGGGAQWDVPGNQCLRLIKGEFGIMSFRGDKATLANESLAFRVPPKAIFSSCDSKKFAGGRFAMQGSTLNEFYYLPDLHPDLSIPDNNPIVEVKGTGITVTALKKSHDNRGFILRIVNMSELPQTATIDFKGSISECTMNEDIGVIVIKEEDGKIRLTLGAKKIETFYLQK